MKVALGNGRWCAVKDVNDSQVTVKNGKCEMIDFKLPIISGYGDLNQELDFNASYTAPSVTATDKDGNKLDVTTTIKQGDQIVDSIDTSQVGSYTVTYTTAPDRAGNTNSVTVIISVVKKETDTDKVIASGIQDGGLELVDDTYYYRGASPKNWVQFDGVTGEDSLWRIVSIEKGVMKLVRSTVLNIIRWDDSNRSEWALPVTVNEYLNTTYKNSLATMILDKIQIAPFYTGKITWNTTNTSYSNIRADEKKEIWNGMIGLMNASDYLYATDKENTVCAAQPLNNTACKSDNWLFLPNIHQWTINTNSDYSGSITRIHLNGTLFTSSVANEPLLPVQ